MDSSRSCSRRVSRRGALCASLRWRRPSLPLPKRPMEDSCERGSRVRPRPGSRSHSAHTRAGARLLLDLCAALPQVGRGRLQALRAGRLAGLEALRDGCALRGSVPGGPRGAPHRRQHRLARDAGAQPQRAGHCGDPGPASSACRRDALPVRLMGRSWAPGDKLLLLGIWARARPLKCKLEAFRLCWKRLTRLVASTDRSEPFGCEWYTHKEGGLHAEVCKQAPHLATLGQQRTEQPAVSDAYTLAAQATSQTDHLRRHARTPPSVNCQLLLLRGPRARGRTAATADAGTAFRRRCTASSVLPSAGRGVEGVSGAPARCSQREAGVTHPSALPATAACA